MEKLGTLIDDAEWRSVQLLIRFLADLINCNVVLGASLLGLFDTFIATAAQPGVKPVSLVFITSFLYLFTYFYFKLYLHPIILTYEIIDIERVYLLLT